MAVPEQPRYTEHVANGVAMDFTFDFLCLADEDLAVYQDNIRVDGAFYGISGIGEISGGTVMFLSPPPANTRVLIRQEPKLARQQDYQTNGDLFARTVNRDFDRIWLALQGQSGDLSSALRLPFPEVPPPFPGPSQRAKKLIAFDENGNPWVMVPAADSATWLANELAQPSGAGIVGLYGNQSIEFKFRASVDLLDKIPPAERPAILAGTSTYDASAAIQAANDEAEAEGKRLLGSRGTFYLANPVKITADADLWNVRFRFSGDVIGSGVPLVTVSGGPYSEQLNYAWVREVLLGAIENTAHTTGTGWAHGAVASQLENGQKTRVIVRETVNCAIGMKVTTLGTRGCVHNHVEVRFSNNCKIALLAQPASANAYVNDNVFVVTRAQMNSAEGTNIPGTRHIAMRPYDVTITSTGWPNKNKIVDTSIEGNGPEYHIEACGFYNSLDNLRWEASPPKILMVGHDTVLMTAYLNVFGGYATQNIVWSRQGRVEPASRYDGTGNDFSGRTTIAVGGDSVSSPQLLGYSATDRYLDTRSATNWTWNAYANGLDWKRRTDTDARIRVDGQNGRIYVGTGSGAPTAYIGNTAGALGVNSSVFPTLDNTYNMGSATLRIGTYFGATGSINTSDERLKQDITDIDDAVFRAWAKVSYHVYRFRDAVAEKGDGARLHVGLIAQEVRAAFENEGLDAFEWGLLCHDEWDDVYETVPAVVETVPARFETRTVLVQEPGGTVERQEEVLVEPAREVELEPERQVLVRAAGDQYALRYEEALALEAAYQRYVTQQLLARLDALESRG